MPTFARIDPTTNAVTVIDISQAQFDALAGNPKRQWLRPFVLDAQPVPTAAQVVVSAGYVIEAARVRGTWALRDKTQAEIDVEAQNAELAALKQAIAVLQADIADGITAAPTTAAQAFVQIQDLKRRALRADRVLLWLLQQQR